MKNWVKLTEIDQLEAAAKLSHTKPVILFKHSTRCGISSQALDGFKRGWDIETDQAEVWYLDLLRFQPISRAIADRFGVHHQSPQIILLKDGKAVYDASHHSISAGKIKEAAGI